jgi:hypothetical protein
LFKFQVFSWFETKKLQKDEILGAFAPKITSFYTTPTAVLVDEKVKYFKEKL